MTVKYYLAPYLTISLNGRDVLASKTMLYRVGSSRHSVAKIGDRSWCIARVDATDAEHVNIEADAQITLIPFIDNGGNYLPSSATVSQVSAANRTAISNFLETRNIPTDWISGATPINRVLKFVIVWLNLSHSGALGTDFMNDFSLSQTVANIPAARRNRIKAWMDSRGIDTSDFTGSMTIRQVMRRLVEQWQIGRVVLGPEEL
jgi:hypothetical protein